MCTLGSTDAKDSSFKQVLIWAEPATKPIQIRITVAATDEAAYENSE
jgi:hypothetical protein